MNKTKQPLERPVKHILVTAGNGKSALVVAHKVGDKYRVPVTVLPLIAEKGAK